MKLVQPGTGFDELIFDELIFSFTIHNSPFIIPYRLGTTCCWLEDASSLSIKGIL